MLQWVTIATQMWRLELIFYINVRKNKQTYLAPLLKAFNWRKCQELFHVGNIWAMPPWMMHKINAKPNLLSHGVILSFQPPVLASQLSGITPPLFVYPVLSPSTSICCWSLGQGHWGNDHVVSWGSWLIICPNQFSGENMVSSVTEPGRGSKWGKLWTEGKWVPSSIFMAWRHCKCLLCCERCENANCRTAVPWQARCWGLSLHWGHGGRSVQLPPSDCWALPITCTLHLPPNISLWHPDR